MNKEIKHLNESINDLVKVQCSHGNWNYDPYMHGMANGMLLIQAMVLGKEPQYLKAPKQFLCDTAEFIHTPEHVVKEYLKEDGKND